MEFSVIKQNGMIGMIELEQVLQCPRVLLLGVLEVMALDWRHIDSLLFTQEKSLRDLKDGTWNIVALA